MPSVGDGQLSFVLPVEAVDNMRNSVAMGQPGILLLLVTCPLLTILQGVTCKAESGHLGDNDPDRCMRHHFVETITHPIYKCNSKVRTQNCDAVTLVILIVFVPYTYVKNPYI